MGASVIDGKIPYGKQIVNYVPAIARDAVSAALKDDAAEYLPMGTRCTILVFDAPPFMAAGQYRLAWYSLPDQYAQNAEWQDCVYDWPGIPIDIEQVSDGARILERFTIGSTSEHRDTDDKTS